MRVEVSVSLVQAVSNAAVDDRHGIKQAQASAETANTLLLEKLAGSSGLSPAEYFAQALRDYNNSF